MKHSENKSEQSELGMSKKYQMRDELWENETIISDKIL